MRAITNTHLNKHGLTISEYYSAYPDEVRAIKPFKHGIDWHKILIGEKPDSAIAADLGVRREYVSFHRRRLGIPSFVGVVLNQSGVPVRSSYEAMYDAYLHWKRIEHSEQDRLPNSNYISDFCIKGVHVEICGMATHLKYLRKLKAKCDFYVAHGIPVIYLLPCQVEELYAMCPIRIRFRSRSCSVCGNSTAERMILGRCTSCYMKLWRTLHGRPAICRHCNKSFTAVKRTSAFCSAQCYWKSLIHDTPSAGALATRRYREKQRAPDFLGIDAAVGKAEAV